MSAADFRLDPKQMSEADAIIDETASKLIDFFKALRDEKKAVVKLGEIARRNQIPMSALYSQIFRRVIELAQHENFDDKFMEVIKEAVSRELTLF